MLMLFSPMSPKNLVFTTNELELFALFRSAVAPAFGATAPEFVTGIPSATDWFSRTWIVALRVAPAARPVVVLHVTSWAAVAVQVPVPVAKAPDTKLSPVGSWSVILNPPVLSDG